MKPVPLLALLVLLIAGACQNPAPPRTQTAPVLAVPPTVQASPTPSPLPIATLTPSPVPPPSEDALIAAVTQSTQPEIIQDFPTANGSFRVQVVRYECTEVPGNPDRLAYEQLLVTAPGGEQHTVAAQLQYCGGLGAYGFNGQFWTSDDRYFYFDEAREGVPDGASCGLWQPGLSRIDTTAMAVERLPGPGSMTPDGSLMVLWAPPDFVLWDPEGGEIARSALLSAPGFTLFSFEITPSGDRLVYVLRDECFIPEANTRIGVLDLNTLVHSLELEAAPNGYVHAAWESEDTLILTDPAGKRYLLTISTGEILPQE